MANYEDITGVGGNALADSHPGTARVLGSAARAWQHAAERLAGSLLPGPDGRIDFARERCLFSAGAYGVLVTPGHRYQGETRFPVDAWLDPIGRLRRATLHIGPQKTSLELADYGQAEGIDLPDASEIVRE